MTSSAHAAIGADLDYAPQAQLGTSADGDRETDVLVIGSGPAGAAAALALARLGVHHMVITKHRWTANTPPAHITNQRTIEIFRDLGIEADVLARGTPHALMGDTVFCTSLAGDELGRVRTWGTHPAREADYVLASPSPNCDIPQTLLEPIIVGHAASRGSRVRFDTEYVGLAQDADGVTVRVRDPGDRRRIPDPRQIRHRRRRRTQRGGRRRRAAVRGRDGSGREHEHRLPRRPVEVRRAPAERSVLGAAAWRRHRRHRARSGPAGAAVERVAHRVGVRHPPAAAGNRRRDGHAYQLVGDDAIPATIRSTSLWGRP
jgi:2,4-dichlorophenol 6-monooxygenase